MKTYVKYNKATGKAIGMGTCSDRCFEDVKKALVPTRALLEAPLTEAVRFKEKKIVEGKIVDISIEERPPRD